MTDSEKLDILLSEVTSMKSDVSDIKKDIEEVKEIVSRKYMLTEEFYISQKEINTQVQKSAKQYRHYIWST